MALIFLPFIETFLQPVVLSVSLVLQNFSIMRKLLFLSFTIFICVLSKAQKISLDQFKNWKPRNIGPSGMSGRITTIDVVLENPNIIYLGSASGGVWKTENSGN